MNMKKAFIVLYVGAVIFVPSIISSDFVSRNLERFTKSQVTPQVDSFFRESFSLLKNSDFNGLASKTPYVSGVDTPATKDTASYLQKSSGDGKIVGYTVSTTVTQGTTEKKYILYYEFDYPDTYYKYLLVRVEAHDLGKGLELLDWNAEPKVLSSKEQPFDPVSYGVSLLVALISAVVAWRYVTRAIKPRWPLLLIILLLSFSFHNEIFTATFPLGALYYFLNKKRYESPSNLSNLWWGGI